MSDPATDTHHDLVTFPQDQAQPRIRLGTFLALLRILAGRRGHATVVWNRFGFTYAVRVQREQAPHAPVLDVDPDALAGETARQRLLDALGE